MWSYRCSYSGLLIFSAHRNHSLASGALGATLENSVPASNEPVPTVMPDVTVDAASRHALVKELVVLCIDVSASMSTPFDADDDVRTVDRTRLEGVKQMLYGFRDQTSNHDNGAQHRLGLLYVPACIFHPLEAYL